MEDTNKDKPNSRRKFLQLGLGLGAVSVATAVAGKALAAGPEGGEKSAPSASGEKVKVLTTDGKVVEVDAAQLSLAKASGKFVSPSESHIGIPGRKFVMVIDLSKCKNARKCIEACQEGHYLPKDHEWMKVFLMQDANTTAPYWFPKPCFHCDNPLCVSVCPVGATYKRSDGIVLVDTDRCIGCKFCMTGCPYSARVFNWNKPEVEYPSDMKYSPERAVPQKEGTVGKCVFCADKLRKGELPRCVAACPMGVLYFGDILEDSVTNGTETVRFSELIRNRAGYRHLENLGNMPSVYYLPPVDRQFPVDSGYDDLKPELKERFKNIPYIKNTKLKKP